MAAEDAPGGDVHSQKKIQGASVLGLCVVIFFVLRFKITHKNHNLHAGSLPYIEIGDVSHIVDFQEYFLTFNKL